MTEPLATHSSRGTPPVSSPPPAFQSPEVAARRQKALILRVVRFAFFTLMVTFTLLAVLRARADSEMQELAAQYWVYVGIAVLLFGAAVAVDLLTPNKKVSTLLGIMVGVLAGLLASLAFGLVIDLVLESWVPNAKARDTLIPVVNTIKVLLGLALSYLGITTVLQTQDDFRLAIPYVEFVKQLRGARPLILDSSALIDARVVDIAGTNLLQSPIIVPSFVVGELQLLADSGDGLKRARGRRGLDVVGKLQRTPGLDISIDDTTIAGLGVDAQLVELAQRFHGMVVTSDVALTRIAQIRQIPVLNLNDLANAMRPNLVPGEQLTLKVVKPGEQSGQGVGYLPDGTMVVVEDGGHSLGQVVTITVGSALQTSAGRLIFGRIGALARVNMEGEAALPEVPTPAALPAPAADAGPIQPEEASGGEDATSREALPRSPFPPKFRSARGGTPRNPRR